MQTRYVPRDGYWQYQVLIDGLWLDIDDPCGQYRYYPYDFYNHGISQKHDSI